MEIEKILKEQYSLLRRRNCKQNAQILYNIAKIKSEYGVQNFHQPLYLDIKKFLKNYIISADNEDFGYDNTIFNRIMKIVNLSSPKEKLSLLHTIRRYYLMNGYEINEVKRELNKQEIMVAKENKKYLRWTLLRVGSSLSGLLCGYLVYAVIVLIALLPAPFNFIELFHIELKNYSSYPLLNYPLNAITLLTGNCDIAPKITPINVIGVLIYSFGILLFYILIVNFLFKKIEDFISIHL